MILRREKTTLESGVDLKFKLGDLGNRDLCTTIDQPRLHTALSLADCILTHGFITDSGPLLVSKNPQTSEQPSFWMSYAKKHTKACTALAMATIAMEHLANPAAIFAAGLERPLGSLRIIRVRVASCSHDLLTIAFQNAALAYMGSIRQAHDIVKWLQTLNEILASTGYTAKDIVIKWNGQAPKGGADARPRACFVDAPAPVHQCRCPIDAGWAR